ncbi:MAG: Phosphoserine phosphatase [candidate division WS6 bacterium OLB20]|uniref:phosphoserine phosphatase n=1 Tax=candidate division WS6 bacterium OLB20 TaxID=1617426 RepID=A0A136LVV3_9BACT|nr:MAG: Phosphoserine phosphatase [candidate division WS6 bacterium OLB20]
MNLVIDFDSTIVGAETLEFLFAEAGAGDEVLRSVSAITDAGMNGEISFSESLRSRLSLLQLNEAELLSAAEKLKSHLSVSFVDVLPMLPLSSTYVVSGGFQQVLETVLVPLGFKPEQLFGNVLVFEQGVLAGLDDANPLAGNNGKIMVAESLGLSGTTIAVGDGSTDLEIFTAGAADRFIYYSEFVDRPAISSRTDLRAATFYEVLDIPENAPLESFVIPFRLASLASEIIHGILWTVR